MNLKEKIKDIIYVNVEADTLPDNAPTTTHHSVDIAAGMIEDLVKELAAEFAIAYLVPSHYTVKESKEVFETFLAEKS